MFKSLEELQEKNKRKPFSLRPGLSTYSPEGTGRITALTAPTDSPFLRSIAEVDRPTIDQPIGATKTNLRDLALPTVKEKLPTIIEKPDAKRDSELGKITSSATKLDSGNVKREYNIGGDTLSYEMSPKELAVEKSIAAIDARIADGFKPTPEQAERIKSLKQRAGFTRGGTDRGLAPLAHPNRNNYHRGNLDIEFNDSVNSADRDSFLRNPTPPITKTVKNEPRQSRIDDNLPKLYTAENSSFNNKERRALNQQLLQNYQSDKNTQASLAARERIPNELKESSNKRVSKVIRVPDGSGGTKEEIWTDDGTGTFHPAMEDHQQSFETPNEAVKKRMIKMKGTKDAAKYEHEYMRRFGKLPY